MVSADKSASTCSGLHMLSMNNNSDEGGYQKDSSAHIVYFFFHQFRCKETWSPSWYVKNYIESCVPILRS